MRYPTPPCIMKSSIKRPISCPSKHCSDHDCKTKTSSWPRATLYSPPPSQALRILWPCRSGLLREDQGRHNFSKRLSPCYIRIEDEKCKAHNLAFFGFFLKLFLVPRMERTFIGDFIKSQDFIFRRTKSSDLFVRLANSASNCRG